MMQEIVEKYAPNVAKHPFEYSFLELWEANEEGPPSRTSS
ncbi:hypothetical protein FHS16_005927 [Paenibacillus endophyticus]|uniref:Uncharacterized protein n=1 Tax=Paenibacillus endophyticus TaxID=1294268 RepID=A0A7W5CDP0_9BACL|nr:hypothetical protein [Paenibacillus endophyticus]